MEFETRPLHVLIVGAGSAGLLTAHVLKQIGIAYTVFEQDANLTQRPRDWNFGIYWAQSRLDECLTPEFRAMVTSVQTDPTYTPNADSIMPLYNGQTGELMKNIPAPWSLRLRRKKWLAMLSKNIDIKWGKQIESFATAEDSVTLTFTDGTRATGDLVVGAEGAHSPTRKFLLGNDAELLPSRIVASVSITKHSREAALAMRELHPRYSLSFHPNDTFTWHSIHDCSSTDPAEWTWMVMQTWPSDEVLSLIAGSEEVLDDIYQRGKTFGSPFREAFLTMPKGTYVWHNRLSYWSTKAWDSHNGLITLTGDAAHPMTFPARDESTYEADLWPRGNAAVLSSLENTNAVHDWENVLTSPLFTAGLSRTEKTGDVANGEVPVAVPVIS